MTNKFLSINNLHSKIADKEILKGLNLEVNKGEIHVIMGPNGAGKSTLANILMGHPKHEITEGEIEFQGQKINNLKVDERAKLGMFLSFQYPEEVPGITLENFLRSSKMAIEDKPIKIMKFKKMLKEKMKLLEMDEEYASRYLNEGFSGGEKKKSEILQMLILEPKVAILDETDSGLDVDAVKIVANGVKKYKTDENSIIIITHHSKILEYLEPDYVHFIIDGKVVKSGDASLIEIIEKDGFEALKNRM
ncbi:Fe-S cluster assembly ATPase SufC [Schnuerera sp. xch1]|uniref:Fe-S cluster assembly ATPase SufC n=1 Tax=Schnuerera sp. xch1 TaxID=2874283 RepID=UPI001CBD9E47|nr:Fe-S cluster assembly ATPase SufC [Schnuerera sp. xch1]MBZ2175568.1 Fe-S cluster assembly ATPase SufC [Schnuerera sp. xch1]